MARFRNPITGRFMREADFWEQFGEAKIKRPETTGISAPVRVTRAEWDDPRDIEKYEYIDVNQKDSPGFITMGDIQGADVIRIESPELEHPVTLHLEDWGEDWSEADWDDIWEYLVSKYGKE